MSYPETFHLKYTINNKIKSIMNKCFFKKMKVFETIDKYKARLVVKELKFLTCLKYIKWI